MTAPKLKTKRKRRSKEETRALLLDAAEAVIRRDGVVGISTVSITGEAGFAQSAFYQHFAGVDECLHVAGERIAKSLREAVAVARRQMQRESLGDFTAELGFYRFILKIFDEQGVAEIILKNRFDPTPLGLVFKGLIDGLREDLADDLWGIAEAMGVDRKHRARCDILSDFLLANALAAGEALIDGRVTDRDLLESQLTMTMRSTCEGFFHSTQS